MPLPHLTYKTDLLKAFKEFGGLGAEGIHLLVWFCNKFLSAPNSNLSDGLISLCVGRINLCLVTKSYLIREFFVRRNSQKNV